MIFFHIVLGILWERLL